MLADTGTDRDTGAAQLLKAPPRDQRIGVLHAGDHSANSSGDQRARARRRAALMAARLERDIERRPLGLGAGLFERVDFGMVAAGKVVIAGADDLAAAHEHGADHRIGAGSSRGFARQTTGQAQIAPVLLGSLGAGQCYSLLGRESPDLACGKPLRSLINSSSSTMNSPMSLNDRYTEANRT